MTDYITTTEAARLLGITPRHARLLCARGKLAAHRLGRDWFTDNDAVTCYAISLTRKSGRPTKKPPSLGRLSDVPSLP